MSTIAVSLNQFFLKSFGSAKDCANLLFNEKRKKYEKEKEKLNEKIFMDIFKTCFPY